MIMPDFPSGFIFFEHKNRTSFNQRFASFFLNFFEKYRFLMHVFFFVHIPKKSFCIFVAGADSYHDIIQKYSHPRKTNSRNAYALWYLIFIHKSHTLKSWISYPIGVG